MNCIIKKKKKKDMHYLCFFTLGERNLITDIVKTNAILRTYTFNKHEGFFVEILLNRIISIKVLHNKSQNVIFYCMSIGISCIEYFDVLLRFERKVAN